MKRNVAESIIAYEYVRMIVVLDMAGVTYVLYMAPDGLVSSTYSPMPGEPSGPSGAITQTERNSRGARKRAVADNLRALLASPECCDSLRSSLNDWAHKLTRTGYAATH